MAGEEEENVGKEGIVEEAVEGEEAGNAVEGQVDGERSTDIKLPICRSRTIRLVDL